VNRNSSSVGIVIRYELDGRGIESRYGWHFPHWPRPALGPTQPSIQWVTEYSWGQCDRSVHLATNPIWCRG